LSVNGRRASGPGLAPVRGSAPTPAGAAPLRPALKSKSFLKGENTLPNMLANLRQLPGSCTNRKSQIRKEARRRSFAPRSGSSFDYKMLSPLLIVVTIKSFPVVLKRCRTRSILMLTLYRLPNPVTQGHLPPVRALLDASPPEEMDINAHDNIGHTPLMHAAKSPKASGSCTKTSL